jgi:hypothetical protein
VKIAIIGQGYVGLALAKAAMALVYALFSFFVTFFVAWVLMRLRLYRLKKRG